MIVPADTNAVGRGEAAWLIPRWEFVKVPPVIASVPAIFNAAPEASCKFARFSMLTAPPETVNALGPVLEKVAKTPAASEAFAVLDKFKGAAGNQPCLALELSPDAGGDFSGVIDMECGGARILRVRQPATASFRLHRHFRW